MRLRIIRCGLLWTGSVILGCGNGFPNLGGSDSGADESSQLDATEAGADGAPDAGSCATVGPNHVCGLAPQCGCGPQSTCDVDYPTHSDGTAVCVQSTGNAGVGSYCQYTSNCATGLSCWGSVCRPYCSTVGLACNGLGLDNCEQWYESQQAVPNATVCEIDCKLDDLYACGGGTNGCIYYNANETDCLNLGPTSTTTCTPQNPFCAPGYACLQDYTCAPWCEVSLENCNGLQCTPFNTPFIVHGIEYGVCQ